MGAKMSVARPLANGGCKNALMYYAKLTADEISSAGLSDGSASLEL